jgi:quercetin dioxygenase-like cupin family protein
MKIEWDQVPGKQMGEGHVRRQVDCGSFFLALHEYEPGWHDQLHSHPHGQFGHVLQGAMRISVEGETLDQGAGQTIFISGNRPHSSAVPDEKTVSFNLYVKPQSE